MTFQPPAPPPPPPPPPPGGGYGAPRPAFDPKSVNQLDWAILGVGALTLIFSFFGFYTASASGGGLDYSESWSAWHDIAGGGFFGWIGMVFAVAGAVVLALQLFSPQVRLRMDPRFLALAGFALGAICEILAIFIHPTFGSASGAGFHASFGHGFSFWIILILTIGGTVLTLMRAQQTGTKLPGALGNLPNIGG